MLRKGIMNSKSTLNDLADARDFLVLGAAPHPVLPEMISAGTKLICCNASGFTAKSMGFPSPDLTVFSLDFAFGAAATQTRDAICNLDSFGILYFRNYAKRSIVRDPMSRLTMTWRNISKPRRLYRLLADMDFNWQYGLAESRMRVLRGVSRELNFTSEHWAQIKRKQPSTGLSAILWLLWRFRGIPIRTSGFTMETSHAYAEETKGDFPHYDTDSKLFKLIAKYCSNVSTYEPSLSSRTGLKLEKPQR